MTATAAARWVAAVSFFVSSGTASGAAGALALVLVEYYLAESEMVGCDLYVFIFLDVFECLFE